MEKIQQVLSLLKEGCRKILTWSIVEKQSMDWIAEQVGLGSSQAAMNQKSRCKKEWVKQVMRYPVYVALVKQLLTESQEAIS